MHQTQAPAKPQAKWCPKCKAFNPGENQFCVKCSASMSSQKQAGGHLAALVIIAGIAGILSFILPLWAVIAFVILCIFGKFGGTSGHELKAKHDAQIVCPQCQGRGRVTTATVRLKKGISGGKATGAILTGGLSLLATGLSRKENMTEAQCSNCGSVWHF